MKDRGGGEGGHDHQLRVVEGGRGKIIGSKGPGNRWWEDRLGRWEVQNDMRETGEVQVDGVPHGKKGWRGEL